MEEEEIVGFLTISMGRITGTLLLAVYYYSSPSSFISRSALGVLLIILSAILAHSGIQKNYTTDSMVVTFCMTVSMLWCNSGIINLLTENNVIENTEAFQNAMLPGLIALSCAFLIMGCVGTLHNQGPLSIMAFALGLANLHLIGLFKDENLGPSAVACNFIIVSIVSIYLVAVRLISFTKQKTASSAKKQIQSPKCNQKFTSSNPFIVTGIIANIISSSVFSGKLLGITNIFFVGQVPWLWTAGIYQLGGSITSFGSGDILYGTFFSLTAILKFFEGYCLLNEPHTSNVSILPLPFMIVFAMLFLVLAAMMSLHNLWDGTYTALFAIYCITLSYNTGGITNIAPQAVNIAIFLYSIVNAFEKLYGLNTDAKRPPGKWMTQRVLSRLKFIKVREANSHQFSYFTSFKNQKVDVIGHAFNTLAAFSITVEAHSTITLLIVTGCMVYISGIFSLSSGKTLEGFAFTFYGTMWFTWGIVKYLSMGGEVRGFSIFVGVMCFLLLNIFLTLSMLLLNKTWILICLLMDVLLIGFLLHSLDILPVVYNTTVSILFGMVSFYSFFIALFNTVVESPQLPWGNPFVVHIGVYSQTS